jgi:hypothetical protein
MKIKNTLIFIPAFMTALLNIQALSDTVISVSSTNDFGCLVIYSGQGYRVGWTQADSYGTVSVSAKLNSEGAAGQTGRAYLTTQIGPGTSVANEIASTNFTFPLQPANLVLFSGLQLPPGSYYLSIIGDSTTWGSCWVMGSATNAVTGNGVASLGGFGGGVDGSYFPASSVYANSGVPPEFSVLGTDLNHPALQISQSGNSILIAWTTNSTGFSLESADTLTSTNWQSITQPIFTVSESYLFETNANGTQFYRLRK